MIILDTINKSLELILGGAVTANQPVFVASYIDITTTTYVEGENDGLTTSAVAVTAVAAPVASTQRQIKLLTVCNLDTASVTLTVQLNNNGTTRTLWKGALAVNEALEYTDGVGFDVIDATGARKADYPQRGYGEISVMDLVYQQRIFASPLTTNTGFLLVSNTAYWTYLGRTMRAVTIRSIEFFMTVLGVGAQVMEVALCSSPNPPNKAAQVLTKLVADGTLGPINQVTQPWRNTTPLNYTVAAGTHLWAGIRTAWVTTQPEIRSLYHDWNEGMVLQTAAVGVLTGAGPWTGAIVTDTGAACGISLRATMD